MREHGRGRPLADVLHDPFVIDHATEVDVGRLLENPHLIRRLSADCATLALPAEEPPRPAA